MFPSGRFQMLETIPHMSLLYPNLLFPIPKLPLSDKSAIFTTLSPKHILKIVLEIEIARDFQNIWERYTIFTYVKSSKYGFPYSCYICFLSKSLKLNFAPLLSCGHQPQPHGKTEGHRKSHTSVCSHLYILICWHRYCLVDKFTHFGYKHPNFTLQKILGRCHLLPKICTP